MSVKIEIVGSSIRAYDSTTGKFIISQPARDTWYSEARLKAGVIQLYDDNSSRQDSGNYDLIFLNDAIDSNNAAFTATSFRAFVYNNIGFNPIVTINTFATRVLSLAGGFLVQNNC